MSDRIFHLEFDIKDNILYPKFVEELRILLAKYSIIMTDYRCWIDEKVNYLEEFWRILKDE